MDIAHMLTITSAVVAVQSEHASTISGIREPILTASGLPGGRIPPTARRRASRDTSPWRQVRPTGDKKWVSRQRTSASLCVAMATYHRNTGSNGGYRS